MYPKGYFHNWVPKWATLVLLVVLLIPLLFVTGVYSSNVSEISSDLGCNSEYISYALNAYAVGVCCCFPFVLHVLGHFRPKVLLLSCISIIAILSLTCAFADNPYIIIICSFLIGFFKMFTNVLLILPLMKIIAPDNNRGKFYAVFYPCSISISQISGVVSALYAYYHNWRHVYMLAVAILLVLALICLVFMHDTYTQEPKPFGKVDVLSVGVFAITFMLLNFLFTFSRQRGWITATVTWNIIIAFIIMLFIFIIMQYLREQPIVPLSLFKRKNVNNGLIQILLVGAFLAAVSLQSAIASSAWGYDNNTNAGLNVVIIPGVTAAGILAYVWFSKGWDIKMYIFTGFASFTMYCIYMYFLISPVISIEYLLIPAFFRGFGMGILFIGVSWYTYNKLGMNEILSVVIVLLLFRNFVNSAAFTTLYGWVAEHLLWQQSNNLVTNMDTTEYFANQTPGGLVLYVPVQKQALLATAKMMFGYISYGGFIILIYILLYRFRSIDKRKIVRISQYIHRDKNLDDERASELAAAVSTVV